MKSVLISIRPEWCYLIAEGKKTVEVRKTRPKLQPPFKAYIYCTAGFGKNTLCLPVSYKRIMEHYAKTGSMDSLNAPIGNGKVIGEFICDVIADCRDLTLESSCLTLEQWRKYTDNHRGPVWGWHISDPKIYDEPKPLSDFYKECAGLDNTGLCYECENAVGEECDCAANGRLHFTRPPQSWCYVEELDNA